MKLLLAIRSTVVITTTRGQNIPYSLNTLQNDQIKRYSDSIAGYIEQYKSYKVMSDSVNLYSPGDMTEIIGLYTERFFYDTSMQLRKVIAGKKNEESGSYYFQDSCVVKAVILIPPQGKTVVYYFSRSDNEMSKYLIERLMIKVPEYSDWLKKLSTGKSYMEEYFKK